MIEHQVQLDGSLRLPERSPGEEAQAEVNGGGIETVERIFEAKLFLFAPPDRLALREQFGKEPLVELRGPVGIRVGQRTFTWRRLDPEVIELAVGEPQPVADLAQAFGLGELAEQHGHALGPAGEALRVTGGFCLADQAFESRARNQLQDLAE